MPNQYLAKTYRASDGRVLTRLTLRGKEGADPFEGMWVEGHGNIGDRIIGRYRCIDGRVVKSGEMFDVKD